MVSSLGSPARLWASPTLTSFASTAARAAGWVVVLPLLLRHFSAAEMAVWYLLLGILSLQLMGDVGFTPVFVRRIAHALGRATIDATSDESTGALHNELATIRATMHAIYSWLAAGSTALVLVVGTIALRRPIGALEQPLHGWLAWVLIAIGFYLAVRGAVFGALLQGVGRVAELRRAEALVGLGSLGTVSVVILLGGGLLAATMATQTWAVVGLLWYRRLSSRVPEWSPVAREQLADRALLQELWPAAWRSGVGVGVARALVVLSGLVYAQWAPAAALASYMLALRIAQLATELSQAPFYSKLPLMARLLASGDEKSQIAVAERGVRLSLWTFATLFVVAAVFAAPGLAWIESEVTWVPARLWLIMGLAFYSERVGAMHLQLYSTTNDIRWHIANGVAGALNLLTVLATGAALGVRAFPLGMLVGNLGFYTWYSARLVYKRFDIRPWRYESSTSLLPLTTMIVVSLLWGR